MRLSKFLTEAFGIGHVTLYRAMSEDEFKQTLKNRRPVFNTRFKWFSPSLAFIKRRVQDGEFNNSKFKTDRYTKLVSFTIDSQSFNDFFKQMNNSQEYMLDRRHVQLVKWIEVKRET